MLREIEDDKLIVSALKKIGVTATLQQADDLWDYYSDCEFANWLGVPAREEDLLILLERIATDYDEPYGYATSRPEILSKLISAINK